MSEVEYIEPTQEHVGQMVEVRNLEELAPKPRQLLALLPPDIPYRFICRDSIDNKSVTHWKYARIARPLTYAERQSRCGLKVGDRVKITKLPATGERGWEDSVSPQMKRFVGSVHCIRYDWGSSGFSVGRYNWPYFVLEKVEDRVAECSDAGKSVYVEGNPRDVFTLEFSYRLDVWRGIVRSGDKRFVYELSNLRVKE